MSRETIAAGRIQGTQRGFYNISSRQMDRDPSPYVVKAAIDIIPNADDVQIWIKRDFDTGHLLLSWEAFEHDEQDTEV